MTADATASVVNNTDDRGESRECFNSNIDRSSNSSSSKSESKSKSTGTLSSSSSFLVVEKGVVDERLHVLGVSGLRIADSSVIPFIPAAPIAATCMTIAEKLADMLNDEYNNCATD